MAFPSIRAVSSGQTDANNSSVSCTHPAGLTTGDLMVLFVHIYSTVATRTITTPSGWTLQQTTNGLAVAQANGKTLACFTRVATAGDVSAGSTTVSFSGATESNSFAFYALTGAASGNEVATFEGDYIQDTTLPGGTSTYTENVTTDITTVSISSLVIGCFVTSIYNLPTTPAVGSSSLVLTPASSVTNNINISIRDGSVYHWTYAGSAQYANDINITNRQITVVANRNFTDEAAEITSIIISINGVSSPNANVSRIDIFPILHGVAGSNTANANISRIDVVPELHSVSAKSSSQATQWTNETKPTTTWTNEQK